MLEVEFYLKAVCLKTISLFFGDVASFFVSLVLIEYVVCSVLIEHVQHF